MYLTTESTESKIITSIRRCESSESLAVPITRVELMSAVSQTDCCSADVIVASAASARRLLAGQARHATADQSLYRSRRLIAGPPRQPADVMLHLAPRQGVRGRHAYQACVTCHSTFHSLTTQRYYRNQTLLPVICRFLALQFSVQQRQVRAALVESLRLHVYSWSLCANMTSSTKLRVHNVDLSQRHQKIHGHV